MRRRPRINKHITPPPLRLVVVTTIILFTIFTSISIWIIDREIEPTLMEIAETRTRQFTRLAINEAVSKKIAEDLQYEQLIQERIDENGYVVSVGWNGVVTNRVVRNTTNRVQNFLRQLEKGEVPDPGTALDVELEPEEDPSIEEVRKDPTLIQIPMGQALGIPILANLGPKIPVNIEVIGDVQSEPVLEHEEVGINSAYYRLYVQMEVNVRVVVPFTTSIIPIETKITIDDRVINSQVPQYYNNSQGGGNADFSIPIDPLQTP